MLQRNVWAEINLDAVAHNVKENLRVLRSPHTKLCAIVKANAYGHGSVEVAQTALEAGASFLAVAITQEGITLREAGITAPILILGPMAPGHAEAVVQYNLSQTVFTLEQVKDLSAAAVKLGKVAKIHLVVETGMNRIGCLPAEAGKLLKSMLALPQIELEGVFSHFAEADSFDHTSAMHQFQRYLEAVANIEQEGIKIPIKHIANSAAILNLPETQLDMARAGITLFGMWPSEECERIIDMQQVMTLKARITHIKTVPVGEKIGYGGTYEVKDKPMRIATLPLGYADGVPRKISNNGFVGIRGKHAPIRGNVCMDQMMVDVTDIPDVQLNDEVDVFGSTGIEMKEVDAVYEVTCRITARVPREYKRKGKAINK